MLAAGAPEPARPLTLHQTGRLVACFRLAVACAEIGVAGRYLNGRYNWVMHFLLQATCAGPNSEQRVMSVAFNVPHTGSV